MDAGGAENDGGEGMPTGSAGGAVPAGSGKGGAAGAAGADRVGSGIEEGSVAFGFPKSFPKSEGFSGAAEPSVAAAIASFAEASAGAGGAGGAEADSRFIAEGSGYDAAGGAGV